MEPSLSLTSSCTATHLHSMSIATCGTACWTGNSERPPWRWLPGARCRAGTLTVRKRKNSGSQLWSCQKYEQGAHLAVLKGSTSVWRRGLVPVLYHRDGTNQRNVSRMQPLNHSNIWSYLKTYKAGSCQESSLWFVFSDTSLSSWAWHSINNSFQFVVFTTYFN